MDFVHKGKVHFLIFILLTKDFFSTSHEQYSQWQMSKWINLETENKGTWMTAQIEHYILQVSKSAKKGPQLQKSFVAQSILGK